MSENKLGQEAAFPIVETEYNGITQSYQHNCTEPGISKRFYAACAAMQGLTSNPKILRPDIGNEQEHNEFAKVCYQYADALLRQENL